MAHGVLLIAARRYQARPASMDADFQGLDVRAGEGVLPETHGSPLNHLPLRRYL